MSTKRLIARNVIWNWAGTFVSMAAGFIVAPFLIDELGPLIYGLWIQIASLTNFFGFLDLGIRGAVGRNIAYLRAKDDTTGINSILNTALLLLGGLAVVGMAAILVYSLFFFDLFDVRPELADKVQWSLVIIGINLGLVLLFNVFDATLWGYQRFDIINAVDIPTALLRTGLVFYFISSGRGLITLSLITLVLTVYSGLLKMWFSFRLVPDLALRRDFVARQASRQLFGYGVWYFILSLSRLFNISIGPQIIANRLGFTAVTPLSISVQLIRSAGAVMVAATGVLMPLATAFHAKKDRDNQQTLFLEGSKLSTALSLFFLTVFLLLGETILVLWLSKVPDAKHWFPLLVILALGEALPMTQMVTWNILLGMARHPLLAVWSLIENLIAIPLSIILINHAELLGQGIRRIENWLGLPDSMIRSDHYGLVGFCIAFALPAVLCRGVLPIVFGCQLLRVPLLTYLRVVLLPTAVVWLPAATFLAVLNWWENPTTWLRLAVHGGLFGVVYVVLVCSILIGWDRIWSLFRSRTPQDPLEVSA